MKVLVWQYYGINKLLHTITANVKATQEEAEKEAAEWCDDWKVQCITLPGTVVVIE